MQKVQSWLNSFIGKNEQSFRLELCFWIEKIEGSGTISTKKKRVARERPGEAEGEEPFDIPY